MSDSSFKESRVAGSGPVSHDHSNASVPTCSVVICTRDRPHELDRCLAAVTALDYPHFEVLVVDNAPKDRANADIAHRWGVRYIVESQPGLSRARNRGALASDSEIVAFIDDDAIPNRDWLTALAVEFQDSAVMAVAGRRLPLEVETEAQQLCDWVRDRNERRVVDRQTPFWFEIANFGGIGTGMNMAFRRRAFDLWPGFHQRLGRGTVLRGGEEHHAFFSLLDRGFRVIHTPDAVVRHPFPATMAALRTKQFKDLSAGMGYIALLLMEEPQHRKTILKYIFEALRGTPRSWRTQSVLAPSLVPWWCVPLARVSGPILYIWSRITEHNYPRLVQPSGDRLSFPADSVLDEGVRCGPKGVNR
jgi:glycosyltransferase involved in cell wall biosynthesis